MELAKCFLYIFLSLVGIRIHNVRAAITFSAATTQTVAEDVTVVTKLLDTAAILTAGTPNFYYMTVAPNVGKFSLNPTTGVLTTITNPGFDYETTAERQFVFDIMGTDGLETGTATLTVDITDVNEKPTLTNLPQAIVIPENTPNGKTIFTVTINDPEKSTGTYNFYIKKVFPPSGTSKFAIDKNKGFVKAGGVNTDFESVTEYWLTIYADDGASPTPLLTTEQMLYVDIFNVNEAPFINRSNYPEPQRISLYEETPIGTVLSVDPIGAGDPDAGDTATFELEGRDNEFFDLVQGTDGRVSLRVAKRIDFESKTPYLDSNNEIKLYVFARDKHQMRNVGGTELGITIKVLDINDNVPVCYPDTYSATISENTAVNTEILKVLCYDADTADSITFTVNGTSIAQSWFQVKPNGMLTVKHPADLETDATMVFYVYAYQGTYPKRTFAKAQVSITIKAQNDNKPKFSQSFYNMEVRYDAPTATSVGIILATDQDLTSAQISYNWVSSITLFSLGSADGIVRVLNSMENDKKYIYFAVAKDNDVPPDYSDNAVIRIDTFPPDPYLVNFVVTRPVSYFTPARQTEFINAVTSGCGGCIGRLSSFKATTGTESTSTTITMYALKDDKTSKYANVESPKVYVGKDELLNIFSVNAEGQPSSATTLPAFSQFPVTKVYAASAVNLTALQWLLTTDGGKTIIALLSIIGFVLLITALVYFFKWCIPKLHDVRCPEMNCDCCKREPKLLPLKRRLKHPDGGDNVFDFRYKPDQPLYKANNLG